MKNVKLIPIPGLLIIITITLDSFNSKNDASELINKQIKIKENVDYLTVINVVTLKAGQKDGIADLLKKGISTRIKDTPGFISASIHKSMDNDLVVVYAQWQDETSLGKAVEKIGAGKAPEMMELTENSLYHYEEFRS